MWSFRVNRPFIWHGVHSVPFHFALHSQGSLNCKTCESTDFLHEIKSAQQQRTQRNGALSCRLMKIPVCHAFIQAISQQRMWTVNAAGSYGFVVRWNEILCILRAHVMNPYMRSEIGRQHELVPFRCGAQNSLSIIMYDNRCREEVNTIITTTWHSRKENFKVSEGELAEGGYWGKKEPS